MLDLIIANARLPDAPAGVTVQIGIAGGRIVALGPELRAAAGIPTLDVGGRLVAPGFVDSHVHLDKSSNIAERCPGC